MKYMSLSQIRKCMREVRHDILEKYVELQGQYSAFVKEFLKNKDDKKKVKEKSNFLKIDMRENDSNLRKSDIRDRVDTETMIEIDGTVYRNIKFADEEKGELWYFPDLKNFPFTMKVVKGKFAPLSNEQRG